MWIVWLTVKTAGFRGRRPLEEFASIRLVFETHICKTYTYIYIRLKDFVSLSPFIFSSVG